MKVSEHINSLDCIASIATLMAMPNYGPANGFWKGGRTIASHGYVLLRVGKNHHLADVRGYAYEHRIMAEVKIGRPLRRGELVHHINGNKQDNRLENLVVCANAAHHLLNHRKPTSNRKLPFQKNTLRTCACGCGRTFSTFDKWGRPRRYVTGHNSQLRTKKGIYGRKD